MRTLVLGLMLTVSSSLAFGCKTCTLDLEACAGYFNSAFCVPSARCNTCLRVPKPVLESESTGILLEQRSGRLLVRKVIANSPAQLAGVRIGDELLLLNGSVAGGYSCGVGWSKNGQSAVVTVQRDNEKLRLQMSTSPLSTILESREILLTSTENRRPFVIEAPFTLGVRWEQHSDYLVVSQVLLNSPADKAGVQIGDRIVTVNGAPVSKLTPNSIAILSDGDMPVNAAIGIVVGLSSREVRLQSRGVASILASPDERRPSVMPQRASLDSPSR